MNEIERLKSIDVNGAIKKALVEQEKSKSLDEIERAIKFLGCVKGYDIQSANLVIEALREQAERSKGCEYCNPNPYGHGEAIRQLITQIFNDNAHIHTFVSGKGLHTIAYPSPQDTNLAKTYSKCKIINFCPVCGKRLEVEHEAD